jgi:PAS domain S-box-containing protein
MSGSISASPTPAVTSKSQAFFRKRFQNPIVDSPAIILNEDGTIKEASPSALRLLDYSAAATISPSFFSLVHGKNLYQVMRDVADMVCYGKARATWLLRLRTGEGRWRWYKVNATCDDQGSDRTILLSLKDVSDW